MPNFNNWSGAGHLTRDPELRTAGQNQVCKFGIAVNGMREDKLFLNVEMWGKRGEIVAERFRKGDAIIVSGSIWQDSYEDKQGNDKQSLVLRAQDFSFVSGKQAERPSQSSRNEVSSDEIPF